MKDYWYDVPIIEIIRFVLGNQEYCLNINDGEFHIDRQESYKVNPIGIETL